MTDIREENLLWRVHRLEQELECLKRDLLKQWTAHPVTPSPLKPSLFGSVRGGDVLEEIVEEAKQSLFRTLEDL